MLPVLVNTRGAAGRFHGGIPRYVNEVLSRLTIDVEQIAPPPRMLSGPTGHLWEQTVLPLRSRRKLLWSPANFGPVMRSQQVISIYDLSPIDHPEWFGPRYEQVFASLAPRVARRSQHVITISSFSAQRIADEWAIDSNDISIAEPGVSDVFTPDPSITRGDDIVAVAGPDPRKNLGRILDSFASIGRSRPSARLTVIGGRRPSGVFAATDERPPRACDERVTFIEDPTDIEVRDLYRRAAKVVFVPLYEGYGLPAAEALACGAPLVTAAIPALSHAHARAAAVVDPTSVDAIAEAMAEPLPTPPSAARRSWDETAATISTILDEHR